jgi:hypothetical protein
MADSLKSGLVVHDRNGGDVHEPPTKEAGGTRGPAPRVKQAPMKREYAEVVDVITRSSPPPRHAAAPETQPPLPAAAQSQ